MEDKLTHFDIKGNAIMVDVQVEQELGCIQVICMVKAGGKSGDFFYD
ncbi:hypothetical protein ACTQ6A_11260 [Lachnospiraceae bacterium LCP25S3_G4]